MILEKMTRKSRRSLFLATVLFYIQMLFLSSCSKNTDLGGELIFSEDLTKLHVTDTFTVSSRTLKQDSVAVFGTNNQLFALYSYSPELLLGRYYTPSFGYSSAKLNFQITPSSVNASEDGSGWLIDSTILSMVHTGYYGPEHTMHFIVHEINTPLQYSSTYYSNQAISLGNKVGEGSFFVSETQDSMMIGSERQPYQLRIPLNASYAQKLLQNILSSSFKDLVPGLQIQSDTIKNQFSGSGQVHTLLPLDKYSRITVYGKKNNVPKTLTFDVGDSCVYFSTFSNHWNGTPLALSLHDTALHSNYMYVQSMQGAYGEIQFPNLKDLLNQGKAIAKAEIEFIAEPSLSNYFPHAQLILAQKNTSGQLQNITDILEGASYYGGAYQALTGSYTFTVTRYIQEQINAMVKDPSHQAELFIIPNRLGVYDAQQTILKGRNNIRLKIYYLNW